MKGLGKRESSGIWWWLVVAAVILIGLLVYIGWRAMTGTELDGTLVMV